MPVSQDWWKDALKELQPSKPLQPLKLLILLTAEEVDDILQGQQTYLLKAQVPANLGRVHLCVRSLDYAILGTVNFAGIQTFSDAKAFTRWANTNLSQGHVERSHAILKSLNQKKTIAAISLEHPKECKEKVFYKHGEAWTAYIIVSIWVTSEQQRRVQTKLFISLIARVLFVGWHVIWSQNWKFSRNAFLLNFLSEKCSFCWWFEVKLGIGAEIGNSGGMPFYSVSFLRKVHFDDFKLKFELEPT